MMMSPVADMETTSSATEGNAVPAAAGGAAPPAGATQFPGLDPREPAANTAAPRPSTASSARTTAPTNTGRRLSPRSAGAGAGRGCGPLDGVPYNPKSG